MVHYPPFADVFTCSV